MTESTLAKADQGVEPQGRYLAVLMCKNVVERQWQPRPGPCQVPLSRVFRCIFSICCLESLGIPCAACAPWLLELNEVHAEVFWWGKFLAEIDMKGQRQATCLEMSFQRCPIFEGQMLYGLFLLIAVLRTHQQLGHGIGHGIVYLIVLIFLLSPLVEAPRTAALVLLLATCWTLHLAVAGIISIIF